MKFKCRSTHRASQLQIETFHCLSGDGGGGGGPPIIKSRLETFKKAIFFFTNYRNPSNYGRSKSSPFNHHDSPIRFLFFLVNQK